MSITMCKYWLKMLRFILKKWTVGWIHACRSSIFYQVREKWGSRMSTIGTYFSIKNTTYALGGPVCTCTCQTLSDSFDMHCVDNHLECLLVQMWRLLHNLKRTNWPPSVWRSLARQLAVLDMHKNAVIHRCIHKYVYVDHGQCCG